jgi:hypothetical protein
MFSSHTPQDNTSMAVHFIPAEILGGEGFQESYFSILYKSAESFYLPV